MAKLNKSKAKEAAESKSDFEPLPEGLYIARLLEVDSTRNGPAGPYWSWMYEVVDPPEFKRRRLWNNTTLAEGKMFGLTQTFDAFGVSTDTDTDDLCGSLVRLQVGQRPITSGARAGQIGNQINRVMAVTEEEELAYDTADAGPDPDDMFK